MRPRADIAPRTVIMLRPLAAAIALSFFAGPTIAEEQPSRIMLAAQGTASATPDMARLAFGIEQHAETAKAALDASSAVVNQAMTILAELEVAEKDIQTSRFDVRPVVVYPKQRHGSSPTPENSAPKVVGYRVSNGLSVRLRDVEKLGSLLDRMVGAGVNNVDSIAFTNADPDAIRQEARRDAVRKAVQRAEVLADASGVKLGRIISIRENGGRPPRPVFPTQARAAEAMSAVPIATGETDYSVTVTMEWAIEQ